MTGTEKEATEIDELIKLNQPLKIGWRRETVISHISKAYRIHGTVRYFAPGSQVELTNIEQIRAVSLSIRVV